MGSLQHGLISVTDGVEQRVRGYIQHYEPLDTPLAGRMDMGCNCYSAGENSIMELIIPTAYKSMLSFFQLVNDVPGYREIPDDVVEIEADEEIEDVETGKI